MHTTRRLVRRSLVLLMVGLVPAVASADEMSFLVVHQLTKFDQKPVGDVEGHVTQTFTRRGLAFFKGGPADGEVAVYVNVGTTDTTKEQRKATAEATFTFDDGSTFKTKNVTAGPPSTTLKKVSTVTAEVFGGTGRFAGITGTASGTGRTMTLNNDETRADSYYNVDVQYTLPKPRM